MTDKASNFIKDHLFNVSTLLAVLTFIVYHERGHEKIDLHIEDQSIHMKFERKIEVFVPRMELDERLKNMEKSLQRIEENINK